MPRIRTPGFTQVTTEIPKPYHAQLRKLKESMRVPMYRLIGWCVEYALDSWDINNYLTGRHTLKAEIDRRKKGGI